MSLKKMINYKLYTSKKALYVFYFVIFCIYAFTAIISLFSNDSGEASGVEISSVIFIFILGLNFFKQDFFMGLQNGVSRKSFMISNMVALSAIAALMTVVDTLFSLVSPIFINTVTIFEQIYGDSRYIDSSLIEKTFHYIVWTFFLYLLAAIVGLFVTTAYYRMSKPLKTAVSIGVPVFFFILLPIFDMLLPQLKIMYNLSKAIAFCLGISNGFNPYYAVVSCFIATLILSGLTYLLTRRAVVK